MLALLGWLFLFDRLIFAELYPSERSTKRVGKNGYETMADRSSEAPFELARLIGIAMKSNTLLMR